MTTRQEKVNSLIRREIAEYLRDEAYEGLTGVVTITEVDVTADLEQAKVYYSVLSQDPRQAGAILQSHIYEIQGMLNRKLRMRKVPRISFVPDFRGEYANAVGKIIRKLHDSGV